MSVASSVDLIKGKVSLVTEYHISIYLSIGIPAAGQGHQVRDVENTVRSIATCIPRLKFCILSTEKHRSSIHASLSTKSHSSVTLCILHFWVGMTSRISSRAFRHQVAN